MRALIQSTTTGLFVSADPRGGGDVVWVKLLQTALEFGVFRDEEHVQQVAADHCDPGEYRVVDLDA